MDSCVEIENFKNELLKLINNSNLTVGTAYYVYNNVGYGLKQLYEDTYKKELENDTKKTIKEDYGINENGELEKINTKEIQ